MTPTGCPARRVAHPRTRFLPGRFLEVTWAITLRSLKAWYGNPAFLVPSIVFPLFFLIAFAGGLSVVDEAPGFDYPADYTAFQFGFVCLQASAFGGVFTGFAIAAMFESGFGRRLLLAAPNRLSLIAGWALAAVIRSAITVTLLFFVALAGGMDFRGGVAGFFGILTLALPLALTAVLFGTGIALRARTIQAGPAMQMPVFLALFLAPVYVPRDLLASWLSTAADLNPITPVMEGTRALLADLPFDTALAYGLLAAMVVVMAVFAVRGLRRAEAAGG